MAKDFKKQGHRPKDNKAYLQISKEKVLNLEF